MLELGRLVARPDDEAVILRADAVVDVEGDADPLSTPTFLAAFAEEVGAIRRPGLGSVAECGDALVDLAEESLVPSLAGETCRKLHPTLLPRFHLAEGGFG
jgi:hypothetical protein